MSRFLGSTFGARFPKSREEEHAVVQLPTARNKNKLKYFCMDFFSYTLLKKIRTSIFHHYNIESFLFFHNFVTPKKQILTFFLHFSNMFLGKNVKLYFAFISKMAIFLFIKMFTPYLDVVTNSEHLVMPMEEQGRWVNF